MKAKPKKILEAHISCPYCKKPVVIRRFEETISPAVKADKKTWVKAEKDSQTKLKTESTK